MMSTLTLTPITTTLGRPRVTVDVAGETVRPEVADLLDGPLIRWQCRYCWRHGSDVAGLSTFWVHWRVAHAMYLRIWQSGNEWRWAFTSRQGGDSGVCATPVAAEKAAADALRGLSQPRTLSGAGR